MSGVGGVVTKRYDGLIGDWHILLLMFMVVKTFQAIHKSYYNITEKQTKNEK